MITLLLLVRTTYMGVLRTYPVRGEPRIQRNASGVVATTSLFTMNRTDRTFFL